MSAYETNVARILTAAPFLEVQDFTCPTCKAAVGSPCARRTHAARQDRAIRARTTHHVDVWAVADSLTGGEPLLASRNRRRALAERVGLTVDSKWIVREGSR